MLPSYEEGGTLEDLCREMWRRDPIGCLKTAEEPGEGAFRHFIQQFQAEESAAQASDKQWILDHRK